MQSNRANPYPDKKAGLWLLLFIHFDAFRADPRAYLTAMWWRLKRKRVRSRAQLARLLGASSRGYDMWLLLEKEAISTDESSNQRPRILALIDMTRGQDRIQETLSNLQAEGVPALLIGTPYVPDLTEAARQIDWSENPWLMPIVAGDRLARGAASTYRKAISEMEIGIAYADDDLLTGAGKRTDPHFKPDWNSELFGHFDYLSGACVLRVSRENLEALAESDDWTRQLVMRAAGQGTPLHVSKILHHRRARPGPKLAAAPVIQGRDLPPLTVIVPTRNRVELLQTCLTGLVATDYPDMEVIIVDNDSDDPQTLKFLSSLDPARHHVLRHAGAFNYSAINNRAVAEARGRLLCLLNNDIEIIEPNWLATMAVQALRQDVGAVGARLLYPDGRIQHAGVVIGMGNAAGHAHRLLQPDEEGYFHRHALPQFVSAVTAACLVVLRDRFLAVGGLDETNFPVAFNDVDLCMRLNRGGYQSLFEPRATLIHHESVSRGFDRDPVGAARLAKELDALKRLWGTDEVVDPFHHPELSRASERFVVRLEA
ncbi:glycosyltransferase family 2 protein [Sphingobium sp. EP60837]|uniref:glycosyltransferase family 2 protein n=1 Tax=Sphingobium sp. EP60837 TaxID=1855519 RepID=UPI0007DD701A|nr:glycosyltransferase family 2 protein [Sphingobium sp. EP60837]ANI78451.1 O-antigen biosynthesis protein RfbC [Sphingobium sp. EP60837]